MGGGRAQRGKSTGGGSREGMHKEKRSLQDTEERMEESRPSHSGLVIRTWNGVGRVKGDGGWAKKCIDCHY